MNANDILNDQVIHVKRGRSNGLGFEPAFNSYFDFYLHSKYFERPLLELEDVTFHLYLRKNLNDKNPNWRMPTMRYMKNRFKIGHNRINAILERLEAAHLLHKESGAKEGEANIANVYVLSDPIPTLDEFLTIAQEGLFAYKLKSEWCAQNGDACARFEHTRVPETSTRPVPETSTHKQTSLNQQTFKKQIDPIWEKALEELKLSLPAKTFENFLENTDLVSIQEGIAVISTLNAYAKDWIENRMANKIKYALNVEGIKCVVLTE